MLRSWVPAFLVCFLSTPASASIDHAKDQLWDALIDSAQQAAAGTGQYKRECIPQYKICTVSFDWVENGQRSSLSISYDINEMPIGRVFCRSNKFDDINTCRDLETDKIFKSMKGPDGVWKPVQ